MNKDVSSFMIKTALILIICIAQSQTKTVFVSVNGTQTGNCDSLDQACTIWYGASVLSDSDILSIQQGDYMLTSSVIIEANNTQIIGVGVVRLHSQCLHALITYESITINNIAMIGEYRYTSLISVWARESALVPSVSLLNLDFSSTDLVNNIVDLYVGEIIVENITIHDIPRGDFFSLLCLTVSMTNITIVNARNIIIQPQCIESINIETVKLDANDKILFQLRPQMTSSGTTSTKITVSDVHVTNSSSSLPLFSYFGDRVEFTNFYVDSLSYLASLIQYDKGSGVGASYTTLSEITSQSAGVITFTAKTSSIISSMIQSATVAISSSTSITITATLFSQGNYVAFSAPQIIVNNSSFVGPQLLLLPLSASSFVYTITNSSSFTATSSRYPIIKVNEGKATKGQVIIEDSTFDWTQVNPVISFVSLSFGDAPDISVSFTNIIFSSLVTTSSNDNDYYWVDCTSVNNQTSVTIAGDQTIILPGSFYNPMNPQCEYVCSLGDCSSFYGDNSSGSSNGNESHTATVSLVLFFVCLCLCSSFCVVVFVVRRRRGGLLSDYQAIN